jgi:hypothetical protein
LNMQHPLHQLMSGRSSRTKIPHAYSCEDGGGSKEDGTHLESGFVAMFLYGHTSTLESVALRIVVSASVRLSFQYGAGWHDAGLKIAP